MLVRILTIARTHLLPYVALAKPPSSATVPEAMITKILTSTPDTWFHHRRTSIDNKNQCPRDLSFLRVPLFSAMKSRPLMGQRFKPETGILKLCRFGKMTAWTVFTALYLLCSRWWTTTLNELVMTKNSEEIPKFGKDFKCFLSLEISQRSSHRVPCWISRHLTLHGKTQNASNRHFVRLHSATNICFILYGSWDSNWATPQAHSFRKEVVVIWLQFKT